MGDPTNKPLMLSELSKDTSVVALGVVAAKELSLKKEVAFFVDRQGQVQLVPVAELLLDALAEEMAIQEMLSQHIDDQGIEIYLRGRDARMKTRNGG